MENNYVIGTAAEDYPDAVREFVIETMKGAERFQLFDDCEPEHLEPLLCERALEMFLGDGVLEWGEEEFLQLLHIAEVHSQLAVLQSEGLIDTIEDERGDEVVWLTDKGKQMITIIKEQGVAL